MPRKTPERFCCIQPALVDPRGRQWFPSEKEAVDHAAHILRHPNHADKELIVVKAVARVKPVRTPVEVSRDVAQLKLAI